LRSCDSQSSPLYDRKTLFPNPWMLDEEKQELLLSECADEPSHIENKKHQIKSLRAASVQTLKVGFGFWALALLNILGMIFLIANGSIGHP